MNTNFRPLDYVHEITKRLEFLMLRWEEIQHEYIRTFNIFNIEIRETLKTC